MELLPELNQLDLDLATKTQVASVIQPLLEQGQRDAEQLQAQEAVIQAKDGEIREKDFKIQALTHELVHIRRLRYGVKSESLGPLQRDLFEETLDIDLVAIATEIEQLADDQLRDTARKPKRPRAGRQPLPDHLPRIEHRHEPASCHCGQCGKDLIKIGEDVTEQLDIEPAKFFVHRHIRPQYACRDCETITAAPIPPAVIDGGMAAVGLLTWIMISKYVDHLPLYRLEQIAARDNVVLARSTLAEWVGRVGVALQPLADRLSWHLLQGNTLHADETPVAQLEPGRGKTRKAYLWAYRSNDLNGDSRIIVFDYQPGRSGAYARQFLGAWQGHLMVDDYGGYKALFVARDNSAACIEQACFAHARRKFFDLHHANQSPMAYEALQRIAQLYTIEAEGKLMTIEQRKTLRTEKSIPILSALHDWLIHTRVTTANGGASARALNYTLKRWVALSCYAETGHLPIDNNPVENCIRPIALGKKNWLFTGSERAGQRAAAIQTLVGTAKLNGLNPTEWLKDTLEKLPIWPNSRIDELLPLAADDINAIKQKLPEKAMW
ncbi:MAG: IS66 family transposase [Methyloprofundus sp.]|jgi:transposase|nr:IS66 family transposase [Methyloprofundus sp.]